MRNRQSQILRVKGNESALFTHSIGNKFYSLVNNQFMYSVMYTKERKKKDQRGPE